MNFLLEYINCDLCGEDRYKILYKKIDNFLMQNQFEYPVVQCLNCGLVYVNPRPTKESMKLFYPDDYHLNRGTEQHIERYKKQLQYLPELTNETILDIGCARGDFLSFLKDTYKNIVPYGVDTYSKEVIDKRINFYNKSLTECGFNEEQFDLITAWAVFEHLHSPSEYFKEVNRILKKDGKFIFLVTNSNSLYGKRAYKEDIPRHTYHFSKEVLKKYADKFNFNFSKIFWTDKIFDGRGNGTFYWFFLQLFGGNWQKVYLKKLNIIQKLSGKFGILLDKIIFSTHWEEKIKRSGIIIVEFVKKN